MLNPVNTYRIQFHKDFNFKNLKEIIPYLYHLGVKTIYASPVFAAAPGSQHGYDVIDPLRINPEIGTLDELRDISKQLKSLGMNWLQDIVPNHMAFDTGNAWLMDVLKHGKASAYARYFDIDWESPVYGGKLMVPFLGSTLEEAITNGDLKLTQKNGEQWLDYMGTLYPVNGNQDGSVEDVAARQAYQLCHWQETDRQINYRRFFTVNGLICLNMQYDEVFDHYHQLIKQLLDEGIFQGLRVDHIDGLYDPKGYLEKLRRLAGPDTYIVVEKILEAGEDFPSDWPVEGNTGYDFLAMVNNLLTNRSGQPAFDQHYQQLNGQEDVQKSILAKKSLILHQQMAGELQNLCRLGEGKVTAKAIAQFLIHCPVYRFYDRLPQQIERLIAEIASTHPELSTDLNNLKDLLLTDDHFYQRCMQFSGPLMAKGVEDTLMYTYHRFIGHNEVGDSPAAFGVSVDDFHQLMQERYRFWPLSMNATSTHDTKRGEDVRARLNAITDMPDEWLEMVKHVDIPENIHPNDAYFILQSYMGAQPMAGPDEDDFKGRMQEYLVKALREGKQHSNWAAPDEAYEDAVKHFITNLKLPVSKDIIDGGIIKSLNQLLLKFTCPGVPDVYQGCELWDLSLVDPDNRRPVDYLKRGQNIEEKDWSSLWDDRDSGRIKLQLTQRLMALRTAEPELFSKGDYLPLEVTGKYAAHIIAFARQLDGKCYVTVAMLNLPPGAVENAGRKAFDWLDTQLVIPHSNTNKWSDAFTSAGGEVKSNLSLSAVYNGLPFALLQLS